MLFGLALALFSGIGLVLLPDDEGMAQAAGVVKTNTTVPTASIREIATSTAEANARIDRGILAPPTATPALTATPAGPTPVGTPIAWTQEEKYALTWLCWHEVRGMGNVKLDGCLSVISTVRARYAYPNGFAETDVIGTLSSPGQFNIEFSTTEPAPDPDLLWAVEQYQVGLRGSCNGYLYFDSVPGGPSLCVIQSSNGQWIEFHNGWD